jgi:hypothetical protein
VQVARLQSRRGYLLRGPDGQSSLTRCCQAAAHPRPGGGSSAAAEPSSTSRRAVTPRRFFGAKLTRFEGSAKAGFRHLPPGHFVHEDGSEFSFVLALNARTAYAGGGTKFLRMKGKPVLRPDQGFASLFAGKNRHCGLAISTRVRYVLAGFLAYSGDERIPDCAHGASADVGVDIAPRRRGVKRAAR